MGGLVFARYIRGLRTAPVETGPNTIQTDFPDQNALKEKAETESDTYRERVERELREM